MSTDPRPDLVLHWPHEHARRVELQIAAARILSEVEGVVGKVAWTGIVLGLDLPSRVHDEAGAHIAAMDPAAVEANRGLVLSQARIWFADGATEAQREDLLDRLGSDPTVAGALLDVPDAARVTDPRLLARIEASRSPGPAP